MRKNPDMPLVFIGILYGCFAIYMLISSFFAPCEQSVMRCGFSQGMVAKVESGSSVTISAFHPFTIGYLSDGKMIEQPAVENSGLYLYQFSTTGYTEVYMLKSSGGISIPTIVAYSGDYYANLEINRTWKNPITQLFQWHLVSVFLIAAISSAFYLFIGLFKIS